MGKTVERVVNAERVEDLIAVFGSFDENLKRIEEALGVQVVNRGTELRVSGDEEMSDKAVRTLEGLLTLASKPLANPPFPLEHLDRMMAAMLEEQ